MKKEDENMRVIKKREATNSIKNIAKKAEIMSACHQHCHEHCHEH